MTTIQKAANRVYGLGQVGGVPIYGVFPEWFEQEFQGFLKLKPEAADWEQEQIERIMEGLWLLDPEDLV